MTPRYLRAMPAVDLQLLALQPRLRIRTEAGKRHIFGLVRRRWFVLTPEELVRQLFLHHLRERLHYPTAKFSVEKLIRTHQLNRRTDILVYDRAMQPWLLVECKRPETRLDAAVFRQIAWYNMPLRVPYLVVTNGRQTYVCRMDYEAESFAFIGELPDYAVM